MLVVCSLIWGLTFVAQAEGAEHITPMWFICLRNVMGFLILLPVITLSAKKKTKSGSAPLSKEDKRLFLIGSAACGFSLCLAAYLQQLAITLGTPSGKAAFITSLYIVLTPIFSFVVGRKAHPAIWFCVALSIAGLYLLCVTERFTVIPSDFVVLGSAFAFTVQILVIEYFSHKCDGIMLAGGQFFFCAVFALIFALVFEDFSDTDIKGGLIPLLYAGIFATGIAYTFQITGQKRLENPTVATMIMSMESVFGVLSCAVLLHQTLNGREIAGCALMFAAIIIAQLPFDQLKRRKKNA